MIKINDYVKVKNGSFPIDSPISVNGFGGKVLAIIKNVLIIRLDAESIFSITDDLEAAYHVDDDDQIIMFFYAVDCIKAKRRDSIEEYENALSVHWNDDENDFDDSDIFDEEKFDAFRATFSQAFTIREFERSPFLNISALKKRNFM